MHSLSFSLVLSQAASMLRSLRPENWERSTALLAAALLKSGSRFSALLEHASREMRSRLESTFMLSMNRNELEATTMRMRPDE